MRMKINIAREVIYRRLATYMGKSSGWLFPHDLHYHHFASLSLVLGGLWTGLRPKINCIGPITRWLNPFN
jgi:hypothetical protein